MTRRLASHIMRRMPDPMYLAFRAGQAHERAHTWLDRAYDTPACKPEVWEIRVLHARLSWHEYIRLALEALK